VFPIQNGLKQGNALSPLLSNFALKYAFGKVQENQICLKLSGTHQPLLYVYNVNLSQNHINAINKNTEAPIDAIKEAGLIVNTEKTKYMLSLITRM
jgi:hypothetical protein